MLRLWQQEALPLNLLQPSLAFSLPRSGQLLQLLLQLLTANCIFIVNILRFFSCSLFNFKGDHFPEKLECVRECKSCSRKFQKDWENVGIVMGKSLSVRTAHCKLCIWGTLMSISILVAQYSKLCSC